MKYINKITLLAMLFITNILGVITIILLYFNSSLNKIIASIISLIIVLITIRMNFILSRLYKIKREIEKLKN